MFGLAHGSVVLAPPEDAFGHGTACLRHTVAVVPGGPSMALWRPIGLPLLYWATCGVTFSARSLATWSAVA